MAKPVQQPLPPDLNLGPGCVVRFTGIDPTTGNEVPGLQILNGSLWVAAQTDESLDAGLFHEIPSVLIPKA